MPTGRSSRKPGSRYNRAVFLGAFFVASAASSAVHGQDAARIAAGKAVWDKAGCESCHGREGRGGAGGEQPAGPSLRRLRMEREVIVETISCGRPSTPMPSNLGGAYTETSCYDMPVGQRPGDVAPGARLTADEIAVLVDYITSLR